MKISVKRDDLADAVAWTARAIPNRPSIPVLAGILLETSTPGLGLSAFNYGTSRRATVTADVAEPGRVLLPGRVLAEIVRALPNGAVDLALDRTEVTVRCGRAEFTLPTLPVDDYPKLPDLPDATGTIDTAALATAVGQVAPATSNDDTVPMLTGICVEVDGSTMTMAATDRYRIAAASTPWEPVASDIKGGYLVPARHLVDMVKGLHGTATIHLSDKMLAISSDGRTTTARLLDPEFIDYAARLAAEDYTIWADFEVAPMVEAVRRVALVAGRSAPVHIAYDGQSAVVQAGGDDGRGAELVDANLDGNPIDIAFMPQYLLDGLQGVTAERARMGMTGPGKPTLILPDDEGDAYRYLVMAVRTS